MTATFLEQIRENTLRLGYHDTDNTFYLATGGVTGIGTTSATLLLSSALTPGYELTPSYANGVVYNDGGALGLYLIQGAACLADSGSIGVGYDCWMEKDVGEGFSEIAGTRRGLYSPGSNVGGTVSWALVDSIGVASSYRLRAVALSGSDNTGYQVDNGTMMTFTYLYNSGL